MLGAGTKHAAGSWLHRPHPALPAPQPPSLCHPDTPSPSSKLFHGQALGAAASLLLPQPAPVPPRVPSKDGAVPAVTASVPPHGTRWQQLPAGAAGGKGLVLAPGRAKPHTRDSVMLLCKLQLQAGCCSGMGFLLHPHPWLGTSCTLDLAGHLLCVPANPKPGTSCTPRPIWGPQGLSGSRHAHKPPSLSPRGPATQQIFRGSEKYEHFPGTGSSVLSSCSCQHREGARPWGGMRDAQTGPLARRGSDLWHGNAWPISTAMLGPSARCLALLGSPPCPRGRTKLVSPPWSRCRWRPCIGGFPRSAAVSVN